MSSSTGTRKGTQARRECPFAVVDMIALDSNSIHLWFVFLSTVMDERQLDQYRMILTVEEREKERRFHFQKDRHCYLVTRALVRLVLSRYALVHPQGWRFAEEVNGRPRIANDEDVARNISFNLAHTDGLVVLAVSSRRTLGVDVENIVTRPAPLNLADSHFAPREAASLHALASHDRAFRFYEYWTLKESYVKADGRGLAIALDSFWFDLDGERIDFSIGPSLRDYPSRWRFWVLQPSPEHVVSLCAEMTSSLAPHLVFRQFVSLDREVVFSVQLLRQTLM